MRTGTFIIWCPIYSKLSLHFISFSDGNHTLTLEQLKTPGKDESIYYVLKIIHTHETTITFRVVDTYPTNVVCDTIPKRNLTKSELEVPSSHSIHGNSDDLSSLEYTRMTP